MYDLFETVPLPNLTMYGGRSRSILYQSWAHIFQRSTFKNRIVCGLIDLETIEGNLPAW